MSFLSLEPHIPEITGMNVLNDLFGTIQQEVMILKVAIFILLFSILFKGAEKVFTGNRGSAGISAFIVSIIAVVFIPNEYILALSTGLGAIGIAILILMILILPWLIIEAFVPKLNESKARWVAYAIIYGLFALILSRISDTDIFRNLDTSGSFASSIDWLVTNSTFFLIALAVISVLFLVFTALRNSRGDTISMPREPRMPGGGGGDGGGLGGWLGGSARDTIQGAGEGAWKVAKWGGKKLGNLALQGAQFLDETKNPYFGKDKKRIEEKYHRLKNQVRTKFTNKQISEKKAEQMIKMLEARKVREMERLREKFRRVFKTRQKTIQKRQAAYKDALRGDKYAMQQFKQKKQRVVDKLEVQLTSLRLDYQSKSQVLGERIRELEHEMHELENRAARTTNQQVANNLMNLRGLRAAEGTTLNNQLTQLRNDFRRREKKILDRIKKVRKARS